MIKACGTEKYDQSYGLGYKVHHGDFSPYPRVNRLRRTFFDRPFNIDIERARLVTGAYMDNPDAAPVMKKALALKNVLENVSLHIYEDELIIGDIAAGAKAAPIYPEYSADWIEDELVNHPFDKREHDKFYITDKDRDELLEILKFWKGKTLSEEIDRRVDDEIRKGGEWGGRIFLTNLYHYGGIGHYCMDYSMLLREGFGGLRERASAALEKLGTKEAEGGAGEIKARRDFYEAVMITLEAAACYVRRYEKLLRNNAKERPDDDRKAELLKMADDCAQIAEKPAQSFSQALQLWHFATTIAQIESNGHSISYGRMDQWLYPYYRKDIDEGRITKEEAQELLECAYIRMGNPSKLKDRMTVKVRNGRGWGGESLTIGGVDTQGRDATNDLTFMMLEASAHTRMMNPWVCLRLHRDTPHELKVKAFECIRAGFGHPKLYNDETAIRVMQKKGMSLEEARDYAVVGCVEPDLPGREFGLHDAAYMNLVKVLGRALGIKGYFTKEEAKKELTRGEAKKELTRGEAKKEPTKEEAKKELTRGEAKKEPCAGRILADCRSMDDVIKLFREELSYWTEVMCRAVNVTDLVHRELCPTPFASAMFESCLEKGRDLTGGGAKYNFSGPQACGIATCADSLSAICQHVFDEKTVSAEEYLRSVSENWEGQDYLYAMVNSDRTHHFGNDDEYADRFYREVFEAYCSCVSGKENVRGGYFCPGVYSVNANVGMGLDTEASADGRKRGEPISDNMGPVHTAATSHDVNGPTAIANSVNKVDHSLATNGTLLNWKFTPQCVAGVSGRENLISFTDAYFKKGATHCQFNIMSSQMMRDAMERPQDYRDMLVRVAGYSAYFVELSKPLQLDLISRTELSF